MFNADVFFKIWEADFWKSEVPVGMCPLCVSVCELIFISISWMPIFANEFELLRVQKTLSE